jgi:hypothetical protein
MCWGDFFAGVGVTILGIVLAFVVAAWLEENF